LIPWFAVTGSNGKSTTQRLTAHLLRTDGKVCHPTANFNNFIGMPLTILTNTAATKFGVLELGTSNSGEIHRLTQIAMPTVAAITNIAPAHLQGLTSVDNVAKEKMDIFSFLPDDGLAIYPAAGRYAEWFRRRIRQGVAQASFAIGEDPTATVTATEISTSPEGSEFVALGQKFFLPLLGRHNIGNALIAIIAARRFGIDLKTAADALATFVPVEGRMYVMKTPHFVLIDDAYNANPASVAAAAATLTEFPAPRRVLILGDMGELGAQSEALHRETGQLLTQTNIETIIGVGEAMVHLAEEMSNKTAWQDIHYFATMASLLKELKNLLPAGAAILVKGSHAMNMRRVVNAIAKM
jgi:UDP-N-acetylmuramoyl-tripeptide--D-alanyl-D-alanine ligase